MRVVKGKSASTLVNSTSHSSSSCIYILHIYVMCIQLYTLHPAGDVGKAVVLMLNQHASAYVSVRKHTSAYVNLHPAREVLKAVVLMLNHQHVEIMPKKLRPRERIKRPPLQHASAYVSIRHHTSAYVSVRDREEAQAT